MTVVGTGIKSVAHCSLEARTAIGAAEVVFTVVPDPVAMAWIRSLHHDVRPLDGLYVSEPDRWATYRSMVETLVDAVREGREVCAVFYGHPGVFVLPSNEAIQILRREGYPATMQPGISAEDCLFADLGVDPAYPGCQSHEGTAFLLWPKRFDPACGLILWQIGVLGDLTLTRQTPVPGALELLADRLLRHYPRRHRVAVYEAAQWATTEPRIDWFPLERLPRCEPTLFSTLYLPPVGQSPADPEAMQLLQVPREHW